MLLKKALLCFQCGNCKNLQKIRESNGFTTEINNMYLYIVNLTIFFLVFPQILWFCCSCKSSVKTSDCLKIKL